MHAAELFELSGRIAVVTGASRGIGEAIAGALADNGAEVVVVSRRLAACETVASASRAAGGKARAQACHIGELAAIDVLYTWLNVNFRGYWFMCQRGAGLMRAGGGGSIVNIASVAGERPARGLGVYSATKAAVINLTQAFAKECAPFNVRVTAILPDLVNTKLAAALQSQSVRVAALRDIPLGRIAEPADIAGAALCFASAASSHATAALLRVDGGINA